METHINDIVFLFLKYVIKSLKRAEVDHSTNETNLNRTYIVKNILGPAGLQHQLGDQNKYL